MSGQEGSIELASVPDRENLVAEASAGGVQICEISYEQGRLCCLCFVNENALLSHGELIAAAEQRMREAYGIPATTPMVFALHSDFEERAFGTATS